MFIRKAPPFHLIPGKNNDTTTSEIYLVLHEENLKQITKHHFIISSMKWGRVYIVHCTNYKCVIGVDVTKSNKTTFPSRT